MKEKMIPKDAIRQPNNHLAEGEGTGHFHDATAEDAAIYDLGGEDAVLDAPSGTNVTHQEHDTIKVMPGVYDRSRVQEYDHAEEEARSIAD